MASLSPTTAPISAKAGRSGSAGLATGAAAGSMRGPATARGGGRRDAEKIGRSCVAVSTDSGTDHSGLPLTGGLAGSLAGCANGFRLPTSTLSGAPEISLGRMSRVDEVAAWDAGIRPAARIRPESSAKPIILGKVTILFL